MDDTSSIGSRYCVQIKIYNSEYPIYSVPHFKHGPDISQNDKVRERPTNAEPHTATNEKND